MIFSFLLFYTGHSLLWEYFSQRVHLPKFCYSRSRFKCHFSESFPDFSPIDLLPPGCRYSSHTWHHPTVWCPVPHLSLHCTAFAPRKKLRIKSRCCYSKHSHSILLRVDGQIMIVEKRKQIKAKEGKQEGKFYFIYLFIYLFFIVVDFVIHWNETAMGLHVFPIPIPPPTSLSTPSL